MHMQHAPNALLHPPPPVFIRFGRGVTTMAGQPMRTPQATLRAGGVLWTGWVPAPELQPPQLWLLSLTEPGGWFEVRWSLASEAVGVQFWGDGDGGQASLSVDGEELWRGVIWGEETPYAPYLSLTDLPYQPHTLRVTLLSPTSRVTLVGAGCG